MRDRTRVFFIFSSPSDATYEYFEKKVQDELDKINNLKQLGNTDICLPFSLSHPTRIGVLVQWTEREPEPTES